MLIGLFVTAATVWTVAIVFALALCKAASDGDDHPGPPPYGKEGDD